MLGQRDGDRVCLLPGGATGAPSSDGAVPFLPAQDLGNHLVDEVLPDLRISEETGDIDEDVVEQLLEFIWMNLEVILIRGVGIDSHIMRDDRRSPPWASVFAASDLSHHGAPGTSLARWNHWAAAS